MQYNTIQYNTIKTIKYNTIQYITIQYNTIQYKEFTNWDPERSLLDLSISVSQIPFINKGIDFIDLPSIFQDKSVTSFITDYFQNSEPPVIC